MLPAEWCFERIYVVSELSVEETAVVEGIGPGNGVVYPHGFAPALDEEFPHGFVGGVIDPQQNLEPGFASHGFGVISPVGPILEGLAVTFERGMIHRRRIDDHARFEVF